MFTLFLKFLTRHGARSPYLSIPGIAIPNWFCSFSQFHYPQSGPVAPNVDFSGQLYRKTYIPNREALPGNCSQGELTDNGALQLQATGKWLRNRLQGFLSNTWDHKTCYARSTNLDRTYASAENLLSTLFEPSPSGRRRDIEVTDVINIWTIEAGYDDLDVAVNAPCPRLKEECSKISSSAAWLNHTKSLIPLRQQLAQAFAVPVANIPDIFLVLEVLRARRAQGLPLPGVTDALYLATEQAATWELVELYNNSLVHTLTSGQLLAEMLGVFTDVVSGSSSRKFTLYAAHDTTIAPLVLALQLPLKMWPKYASNVYFALWQSTTDGTYYVEILHDEKPVAVWPLSQFIATAQLSIVPDRNSVCNSGAYKGRHVVLTDPVASFLC